MPKVICLTCIGWHVVHLNRLLMFLQIPLVFVAIHFVPVISSLMILRLRRTLVPLWLLRLVIPLLVLAAAMPLLPALAFLPGGQF